MPKLEGIPSARTRPSGLPPARRRTSWDEEELTEEEIRAIEEGLADHRAGRTFTLAEIKREFGIDS